MKIGLIDSGIGGLTILKSLLKRCPNHEYIYYGDTLHMPYGDKSKKEIISYTNKIIEFLESENVDLVILACGTISSHKEALKCNKRIIDIISPINNKLDRYNKISIIATSLSIKTNAFKKYINTQINLIACPRLASIIESNNYDELGLVLEEYLESTWDSDALILGCTHYPIIKDYIKKYFKKDIIYLDTFVVELVKDLEESISSVKLYFSKVDTTLEKNVKRILELNNIEIERKCL